MINKMCRAKEADIPLEPTTLGALERDEIEAWRRAAMRVGEELADCGPDGYYALSPERWRVWALAACALLKERLLAREQELRELKAFYYRDSGGCESA